MSRYPASPPPLSNQDTYTSWPGGVDPTARVYDSVGGKRVKSPRSPRSPKRRRATFGGKSPKSSGKLRRRRQTPKRRRVTRKNRKSCRRTRRH